MRARSAQDITRELLDVALEREVPSEAVLAFEGVVRAEADRGRFTMSDLDVRLWFLAWSLHTDDPVAV